MTEQLRNESESEIQTEENKENEDLNFCFLRSLLFKVAFPNQSQTFQRQVRRDGGNFRQLRRDQFRVAARRNDRKFFCTQLAFQFDNQPANQTAIAMNRADEHRSFCAFADDIFWLADFYFRQQRRSL